MFQYENGGPGVTWSSVSRLPAFADAQIPMPIIVADGRAPGEILVPLNTTVFEFNPFEFGSFDPTVHGFAPLRYLGTNFSAGKVPANEQCVQGFDQAGYIIGTSSTLFNQIMLQLGKGGLPGILRDAVYKVLSLVSDADEDIATYSPNPFYMFNPDTNTGATSDSLTLVDGGEDYQNIPLHPLIQPDRNVDVIFAVDSSADTTYFWPNGTSLVSTYQRSVSETGSANWTSFPSIPDQNTFVNLGLNQHPTFFGCDSKNITGSAPIIVYIPNFPYVFMSNVSTFDLEYKAPVRNAIIENGYNVATLGNATEDSEWPTCVGCAIISRSLERNGEELPEACKQCFQKHCWDGTVSPEEPAAPYAPSTIMKALKVEGSGSKLTAQSWLASVALVIFATVILL
jgi:lysophospholipase